MFVPLFFIILHNCEKKAKKRKIRLTKYRIYDTIIELK